MILEPTCDLPPVGVMAVASYEDKQASSTPEATDLIKVLFDEMYDQLNAAGLAL